MNEVDAIHHQLRVLGRDRAELDAAEAHYIRAGHAVRIWEAYGFASYAAYLEAVFGYGRVPGCGNATWLDVHHIRPRAGGGDHVPGNLLLLCSTHHRRVHAGRLDVERVGDRLLFRHADGTRYRSELFWRWSASPLGAISDAGGRAET